MKRLVTIFIFLLLLPTIGIAAKGPDVYDEDAAEEEMATDEISDPKMATFGIEYEEFMGRTVSEINLVAPPTISEGQIMKVMKLKVDRPFTRRRCRFTIRSLYLRGDVSNVIIKASIKEDGTVLAKVTVEPLFSYREFFITGIKKFNEDEIRRFIRIGRGDEYNENDLSLIEERIKKAYAKAGYFATKVNIKATLENEESKADLVINIKEGKSYRMRRLYLTGDLGVPVEKIYAKLGWKLDRVARNFYLENGPKNLGDYYRKQGFNEAKISEPVIRLIDGHNKLDMDLHIEAGKFIRIEYDKEAFSYWERKYKLDKILEISKQRKLNRWVALDMAHKLEVYLKRKGYDQVKVAFEYSETDTEKLIKFIALPGDRWKIERIKFEGVTAFSQKDLRRLLDHPKYYEVQAFETALTHIIGHYNQHGFLRVKITGQQIERRPEKHRLDLILTIDEGVRTSISRIRFNGNKAFDDAELGKALSLKQGQDLNPFLIKQSINRINELYSRNGYIRARIENRLVLGEAERTADLIFEIIEERQYLFGEVYLKGNRLTNKHIILREMFISEGEPYNYENVFRSEQALSRLGFFRSVKIQPITGGFDEEIIDLVVLVSERNAGYGSFALGFNTVDGYESTVEIGHRNLAGHGRKVSLLTQVFVPESNMSNSDFNLDEHLATITFFWPWIARIPLDGTLTITDQAREESIFDAAEFRVGLGISTDLARLFYFLRSTRDKRGLIDTVQFIRVGLEYAIEQNYITNVDEQAEENRDIERGEIFITTLVPQVTRNSKNDAFYPTRGSVNRLSAEWATPYLGSDVHYLKLTGNTSWYFGLDRYYKALWLRRAMQPIDDTVIAFNFSTGWISSFDQDGDIPINKRFFLGGINTIRGYNPTQVGPLDTENKDAIGGNFMFHSNFDLRFRLPYSFGLLVFFDAGNVYEQYDKFTFPDIRYSTGLGLRYITPVGPISADYGFALTRWHETDFGQFYITIGNAF